MSNPYAAPDADLNVPGEDGEYEPKIFSLSGRIGRLRYFGWGFLLSMIAYIPMLIAVALIAPNLDPENQETIALLVTIPFIILMIAISFVITRRRLHDLGRSSWFMLLLIVPILNILMSFYLLLWPGTPGANRFGLPPTKNGSTIWIALIAALVLLIGIVAAVALPAYQDYVKAAAEAANY